MSGEPLFASFVISIYHSIARKQSVSFNVLRRVLQDPGRYLRQDATQEIRMQSLQVKFASCVFVRRPKSSREALVQSQQAVLLVRRWEMFFSNKTVPNRAYRILRGLFVVVRNLTVDASIWLRYDGVTVSEAEIRENVQELRLRVDTLDEDLRAKSIDIARRIRRLPLRFNFQDRRSGCLLNEIRDTTLQRVAPKFEALGVKVLSDWPLGYKTGYDETSGVLETEASELLQHVKDASVSYVDVETFAHVMGSLFVRNSNPAGPHMFIILNSWYIEDAERANMKFDGLAEKNVYVYVFPNDIGEFAENIDIQRFDFWRYGEGQCQDWSLILAYEFFKTFQSKLSLARPNSKAWTDGFKVVVAKWYDGIDSDVKSRSFVLDLQRQVGLLGGAELS